MKEIDQIANTIDEVLSSAMKYARYAIQNDSNRELAKIYRALADEELDYVVKLHNYAKGLISVYKDKYVESPEKIIDRYLNSHERHVKKYTDIKILIE